MTRTIDSELTQLAHSMVAGQLQVLVISFFWQLMAWFLMSLQPGCGMKQEAYIGTDAGCVWVWVWVWVCVCVGKRLEQDRK